MRARTARESACFVATFLCALVFSHPASAYRTAAQLSEISSATPVAWRDGQIEFFAYTRGSPTAEESSLYEAMLSAFPPWEAAACGSLQLSIAGYTNTPARAGDGRNTVTRVESGWGELRFPAGAAAYTDVSYSKGESGWAIVEADVYINAENYSWVPFGATASGSDTRSLQAILTHEVGHALGLLHPCEEGASGDVPACSVDPSFQQTMMYPIYDGTKLELVQDDVAGLCSIYGCASPCEVDASAPQPVHRPDQCSTSADCALGQNCRANQCTDGFGLPGDPCQSDYSCASSRCNEAGYCADVCDAPSTDAGECTTFARGFGQQCKNAGDCLGVECLNGAGPVPLCTRECSDIACPNDWVCATVTGKNVCAPLNYRPAGGGCSLRPGSRLSATELGFIWVQIPDRSHAASRSC